MDYYEMNRGTLDWIGTPLEWIGHSWWHIM